LVKPVVDRSVNNAGVYPSPPTGEVDEAVYVAMSATNVQTRFVLTQALDARRQRRAEHAPRCVAPSLAAPACCV
jgi:NADP-dependent 3-hydroxy acid dehydrogenase YdfG